MQTPDFTEETNVQVVDHEGVATIRMTVNHGDPSRGGGEQVEYTRFTDPKAGLSIANALRDLCLEKIRAAES